MQEDQPKTCNTASKAPEGITIIESPALEAAKENQTSLAEVDVLPPQVMGARLWVAPALLKEMELQVEEGIRFIALWQLSFEGWANKLMPGEIIGIKSVRSFRSESFIMK